MSRLCRLKTGKHGDTGRWAYGEIIRLRSENHNLKCALEVIAGKAQCVDNLISNQDIALAALGLQHQENIKK